MSPRGSQMSFRIGFLIVTVVLPSVSLAQSARAQELTKQHEERINRMREQVGRPSHSETFEQMREDAHERMAAARKRHDEMFSDLRVRSGRPNFASNQLEEMRRESDEQMAEVRRRHEEVVNEMENRSGNSYSSSSSNSGRSYRIRGRAIRGIIMLVLALCAGVVKLFGYLGGNSVS